MTHLTHAQVVDLLPLSPTAKSPSQRGRVLRRLMDETPEHVARPWGNLGTASQPRYVWRDADAVWAWFWEVTTWRASAPASDDAQTTPSSAPGSSVGASRTRRARGSASGPRPATRGPRLVSSSPKSSAPRTSASGTSHRTLAQLLRADG